MSEARRQTEIRDGQIWKAKARNGEARYVKVLTNRPARSIYVTIITVVSFGGGPWLKKYGARATDVLYSRFNGRDFALHQDVAS